MSTTSCGRRQTLRTPRPAAGPALPGVEALAPAVVQRAAQAKAGAADDHSFQPSSGEDFLIEPGAGAPQRAREARELAQMIGPKTNPAVSVHIAAARRAAQAALAESDGAAASGRGSKAARTEHGPLAARGVQNAKAFFASHKRTVLLGVALALAATVAVRAVGVRAPFLQRSELDGQAVKTREGRDLAAQAAAPPRQAGQLGGRPARRQLRSLNYPPRPDAPDSSACRERLRQPSFLRRSRPGFPRACATPSPPARRRRNTSSLCACSKAGGCPRINRRPHAGSSGPPRSALPRPSIGLDRCSRRASASLPTGRRPKRWYLKAAEAGNARAAHNLAVMDAEPAGDEPDYVEAAKWFRKAGEFGVRDSQYNLAILYARGLGVGQDLRQSWMWFSLAAQQGDADAGKKRDEVAAKMDPASLADAAEALAKFRPLKPDPAQTRSRPRRAAGTPGRGWPPEAPP